MSPTCTAGRGGSRCGVKLCGRGERGNAHPLKPAMRASFDPARSAPSGGRDQQDIGA